MGEITLAYLKAVPEVQVYIKCADRNMEIIGYTEHGFRHADIVAERARYLLRELDYEERACEVAAIAAYLHDIGNVANRVNHATTSVLLAHNLLQRLGMPPEELVEVLAGVGNHEEEFSEPFGPVAAAVTIADKSDVNRSRVRNPDQCGFDPHDRINWAAVSSDLVVDRHKRIIALQLDIDTAIGSIMEYFELFLVRMVASRRAAEYLGCRFSLVITGTSLL
jgi:hypothetical protein